MSEEKKIFDKKFVHFMWDDGLDGREGFVSDDIPSLQDCVEGPHYKLFVVSKSDKSDRFPFKIEDDNGNDLVFKFFYYDPLYEFKLAQKQGKTVQYMTTINVRNGWADVSDSWNWNINPDTQYRIKPEKEWRPFKDVQEFKNAWYGKMPFDVLSTGPEEPMIWVRWKGGREHKLITGYYNEGSQVFLCDEWISLERLFKYYEFLDGSRCGVEEEVE